MRVAEGIFRTRGESVDGQAWDHVKRREVVELNANVRVDRDRNAEVFLGEEARTGLDAEPETRPVGGDKRRCGAHSDQPEKKDGEGRYAFLHTYIYAITHIVSPA